MSIRIEHLNKSFGPKKVLTDLNLELEDDHIYCLMGPSGMGKTTLLRILLGLETADSGTIEGIEADKMSAMYQEDRLLHFLNPVENIALVYPNRVNKREIRKNLEQILPPECLKQPVSQLSGGMKRRVALARAMHYPGSFIILDEPFTGLDRKTKEIVIGYIKSMRKDRIMLIATHGEEDVRLLEGSIVRLEEISKTSATKSDQESAARQIPETDPLEVLESSAVFRGLNREEIQHVIRALKGYTRNYLRGEYITISEDEMKTFGIVIYGEVDASMEMNEDRHQIINRVGAGDMFGGAVGFSNQISWIDISAIVNTQVMFFHADLLLNTTESRELGIVKSNMIRVLSYKLLAMGTRTRILRQKTTREKLLAYLNTLPRDNNGIATVPFTQVDLAEYLSASRTGLSADLKLLREEGIIEMDGRHIRVKGIKE